MRLVEGGRLDARRKASAQGARRRQLVRKWRAQRVAYEQGVGFAGGSRRTPPDDPLAVDDAPMPSRCFLSMQKACQRADRQSVVAETGRREDTEGCGGRGGGGHGGGDRSGDGGGGGSGGGCGSDEGGSGGNDVGEC